MKKTLTGNSELYGLLIADYVLLRIKSVAKIIFDYNHIKRVSDVVLSVTLLIACFPMTLILLVAVYLETGESPLFVQERGITLERHRFRIFKIRTLRSSNLTAVCEDKDIFVKSGLSTRITRLGGWLRRSGLDELPQLINILKGEMSFIGPRPLSVEDLETLYAAHPELYDERNRITSRPGISGYWQIFGDRKKGAENLLELEMKYEKNRSFTLDLFLIMLTVPVILFAKHIDAITMDNCPIEGSDRNHSGSERNHIEMHLNDSLINNN